MSFLYILTYKTKVLESNNEQMTISKIKLPLLSMFIFYLSMHYQAQFFLEETVELFSLGKVRKYQCFFPILHKPFRNSWHWIMCGYPATWPGMVHGNFIIVLEEAGDSPYILFWTNKMPHAWDQIWFRPHKGRSLLVDPRIVG